MKQQHRSLAPLGMPRLASSGTSYTGRRPIRAYYVYIVTSVNRKVMYVGVTNNLENRIAQHRGGTGSAFTSRYRVDTLVHAEEYQYVEDAIAREKEIKGWRRSKKDAGVEATNPSWANLLETSAVIDPSLRSG